MNLIIRGKKSLSLLLILSSVLITSFPIVATSSTTTTTAIENHPPSADSLTPVNIATNVGTPITFTLGLSDPDGWQDIAVANLYLAGDGGLHNEWLHYLAAPNLITMMGTNDFCSPGQEKTISSGYLTLDCGTSSVSGSGTTLTVNFRATLQPSSRGILYNLFFAASDQFGGANAKFGGSWSVNGPLSADSLTPSNITTDPGMPQSFTAAYYDPDGWQNLSDVSLYIAEGSHSEWLHYNPVSNRFTMAGVGGDCSPGEQTTLSSGSLSLNCNASSVSGSGNTVTVIFNLTPQPSFSGGQYIQVIGATDQSGATDGTIGGSWTVVSLQLQTIATGLSIPTFLTSPPGDNNRLFIVEKTGTIRIIKNGTLLSTPFLDIGSLVSNDGEQGLLGLAFDPNYAMTGRFYVYYTDTEGHSRVARFLISADPDIAMPSPDRILLTNDAPAEGHYGGDLIFGPDGYLYASIGDGGCCFDPHGHGQDLSDLMGSLLRIDVSPQGDYVIPTDNPFVGDPVARAELWNYGLRNPWRFSFDRLTGNLYIADVGQNSREEIDVSTASAGGGKGLNYGWSIMEGFICVDSFNCNQTGLTLPVLDYDHSNGCSVTGGYVYRGSAIPAIRGVYFYGDYCSGWVRSFVYQDGQAVNQTDWASLRPGEDITSFGEDAQGELYILTYQGGVYRIISGP